MYRPIPIHPNHHGDPRCNAQSDDAFNTTLTYGGNPYKLYISRGSGSRIPFALMKDEIDYFDMNIVYEDDGKMDQGNPVLGVQVNVQISIDQFQPCGVDVVSSVGWPPFYIQFQGDFTPGGSVYVVNHSFEFN